ncbi:MAG: hypothetical protein WD772_09940, partial [Pseudohongiellaceae bacterium]
AFYACMNIHIKPDMLLRVATLSGALAVTVALYWVGLRGAFLLDDLPNLGIISRLPPEPAFRDFWNLAVTGLAGPLGRPVSLLSFLWQYQTWPDPFAFKLANLVIHLVNGILVALMCALIGKCRSGTTPAVAVITLSVFIWLANPVQVSTVLYVVQRMTQLSAMFSLAGICVYLTGRRQFLLHRKGLGVSLMAGGTLGGALLASLSKETGVLIFPYIAVLEFTLLTQPVPESFRRVRRFLIYWPLALGFLAFCAYVPSVLPLYDLKPFGMGERVLTQFPVLLVYLASAACMLPNNFGLFHDDFPTAQSLLADAWVIPCILIVVSLLTLALLKRRQWPWLSFAILWFFAGHSLESTIMPLELYFEHRNYLPLLGPVLALVTGWSTLASTATPVLRNFVYGGSAILLLWMSLLCFSQTRLWGNPLEQAFAAYEAHPGSYMAQSNLVYNLSSDGQTQEAFEFHLGSIDPAVPRVYNYVRWLEFGCLLPGISMPADDVLGHQARESRHDYTVINMLNSLTFGILGGECVAVPVPKLLLILQALSENPAFAISYPDLYQLRAFLLAGAGDFQAAAELASRSFSLRRDVRVALYRVAWLVRVGESELARTELEILKIQFAEEIAQSAEFTNQFEFLDAELD